MRMLDLFCGRFGWSRAFAARGWECVCIDLVEPPELPAGCRFIKANILDVYFDSELGFVVKTATGLLILGFFDFICASSPCEQFSVHGMKHFHPNPPYPELGIKLFNHTREICEASGVPYVMENVRAAQQFVGKSTNHCGPFHLWGSGVPHIVQLGLFREGTPVPVNMPRGIVKGMQLAGNFDFRNATPEEKKAWRKTDFMLSRGSKSKARKEETSQKATIPPELSNCVADYAERLLEQGKSA